MAAAPSAAAPPRFDATPTSAFAPTNLGPTTDEEKELCAKASHTDWLYLGGLLALDAGSIFLDSRLKYGSSEPGIRTLGPAAVGLTWGATVGGLYLSLPKCNEHWVGFAPPEGDVRTPWALAFGLAMLAGATAPITVGVEIGAADSNWSVSERVARIVTAGVAGFAGAFIPYLLPPKTWRAARKLEGIRAGTDGREAFVGYSLRF